MKEMELTPEQTYEMWKTFGIYIGLEELKKAYGFYWPREVVSGERVWEFLDDQNNRIGWCALRLDPIDPMVWQISGVFPQFKGKGHVREIFKWCIKKTFTEWPKVKAMFYSVSKANAGFLEWNVNKVKDDSSKTIVGEINFPPPGYVIFAVVNKILKGENYESTR